jgi:hypothetical protein
MTYIFTFLKSVLCCINLYIQIFSIDHYTFSHCTQFPFPERSGFQGRHWFPRRVVRDGRELDVQDALTPQAMQHWCMLKGNNFHCVVILLNILWNRSFQGSNIICEIVQWLSWMLWFPGNLSFTCGASTWPQTEDNIFMNVCSLFVYGMVLLIG